MLKNTVLISCELLLILTQSCISKQQKSIAKLTAKGYVQGIIKDDTEIAGCGFSILLEDNKLITPQNLSEEFKKDNLKVLIKYTPLLKQPITTCMRGQIVTLTEIIKP